MPVGLTRHGFDRGSHPYHIFWKRAFEGDMAERCEAWAHQFAEDFATSEHRGGSPANRIRIGVDTARKEINNAAQFAGQLMELGNSVDVILYLKRQFARNPVRWRSLPSFLTFLQEEIDPLAESMCKEWGGEEIDGRRFLYSQVLKEVQLYLVGIEELSL